MPKKLPPGANPLDYIEVKTKEGTHYRKKRGSVKPAKLNSAFAGNAEHSGVASPAAKRIKDKLQPCLGGLQCGRLIARISGKLRESLNRRGQIDFLEMAGFELQKYHPLKAILKAPINISARGSELIVSIPVEAKGVKQHSPLITHYCFELVLLRGDATVKNGLRIESSESEKFVIGSVRAEPCMLNMIVPKKNWMVFLKVSCFEGNDIPVHPRHYGMSVVGVG